MSENAIGSKILRALLTASRMSKNIKILLVTIQKEAHVQNQIISETLDPRFGDSISNSSWVHD